MPDIVDDVGTVRVQGHTLRLIKVVCMCQANHYLTFVIHRDCRYCNVWRHTPTCTDISGWAGHELKATLDSKSDIEADDVCTL